MTGKDFTAFLEHMGWRGADAARELGISRNTIPTYKKNGAPKYIAYACAAIAFGLPKWTKTD